MRIAILDCMNYDIGLKILFPEAHYYICASEIDKSKSYDKYNFKPKLLENYSSITSSKYDVLFIVLALYDTLPNTKFYKPQVAQIYDKIKREILDVNTFEKVVLFDNYDYDYDPSTIAGTDKIDAIMKRNYNKTKVYNPKVHPFPFIMFGEYSIIEKLDNIYFNRENRHNEIFFRLFILSRRSSVSYNKTSSHHLRDSRVCFYLPYGVLYGLYFQYEAL